MNDEEIDGLALPVLQEFVRIDSTNPGGREADVADRILDLLSRHGAHVDDAQLERIEHGAGRSSMAITLPGRDESRVVGLAGHMDTVPTGDATAWSHGPLSADLTGTTVWGRGSTDMKGGDTAMLLTYLSYATRGERPPVTLRLYFTSDEESLGTGARSLESAGAFDDLSFLFVCEPTACRPGTCEKGCVWVSLEVTGQSSHASMPERGTNALELGFSCAMSAKHEIERMAEAHPLLGANTSTITLANGGTKTNMVPASARITADTRLVPATSVNAAEEAFRQAARRAEETHPGLAVRVSAENGREALEVPSDHTTVLLAQEACSVHGASPEPAGVLFYTDGSLVIPHHKGLPFLILGPGDPTQCHRTDEHADWREVSRAWRIYRTWIDGCTKVL